MGILNKILKENNLTPYSPELKQVLDEKINEVNLAIDIKQSELNKLRNNKKVLLSSLRNDNSDDKKLPIINDKILESKRSIFTLSEEVNEIESIKNIINYQSKLSGIKKEIGELNQDNGSDLVSKLKNKK
ncbi:MAG: hypothetical protein GQ534_05230 [Candidatus Delongbacteria bacterium]|nr:hypothetical protein [Candidatus Delongbacteria bacterium]